MKINYELRKKDAQTVERALQGDQLAYERMYASSFGKAVSVIRRYNADKLLTNDEVLYAADEAFEKCALKLNEYKNTSLFSTWLCGFAKNVVRNARRKKLRGYEKQRRYQSIGLSDLSYVSPEYYVLAKEQYACAWAAYRSLDELSRILISWNILGELSEKKMLRLTKLTRNQADRQAAKALIIMRRRFFEIYGFVQGES